MIPYTDRGIDEILDRSRFISPDYYKVGDLVTFQTETSLYCFRIIWKGGQINVSFPYVVTPLFSYNHKHF